MLRRAEGRRVGGGEREDPDPDPDPPRQQRREIKLGPEQEKIFGGLNESRSVPAVPVPDGGEMYKVEPQARLRPTIAPGPEL